MLLLVTLTFALCNALPFLLNLTECIKTDLFLDERTAPTAYLLNDLANFLVVLNRYSLYVYFLKMAASFFSSTTWIFYTIFSAKYREGVIVLLGYFLPGVFCFD